MKKIINDIRANILFKIASVNSIAVVIRIVSGFLTSNAIAVFIGTEGIALVGNLRDFLSSAQSFSTLGFTNGIVKYVSEFKNKAVDLSKTVSTAVIIGLFATFLVSLYCFFNASYLNDILFTPQKDYSHIIKILAVLLPLYSINVIVLAIINGLSQFKRLLNINIAAQIVAMVITLLLIWKQQLEGALIAVAIVESIIIFVTLFGAWSQRHLLRFVRMAHVNFESFKNLGIFSLMTLFTALALPLVKVAIRNYIIDTQSLNDAGIWEAMNRISGYYLMFINTLLALYLLPRFAEIDTKRDIRKEIFSFYKAIMPIFALGLIVVYFFRHLIINIIFTSEFSEVESLFFWQLLGDFIKVLSIVIAYQFLAKRMFWYYIISEALSIGVLYVASLYFIDLYGIKGATIAHFVDYLFYLILMVAIFWRTLFGNPESDNFTSKSKP